MTVQKCFGFVFSLLLAQWVLAADIQRERDLPRLAEQVSIDGRLDEQVWNQALKVETFYEISPGDNTPPVVQTDGYLWYDQRALYVGFHCFDPDPRSIRSSYSDRDSILADQDFVQFDLDTKNDEKSSFIFRTNPRGVQADAIFSEATGLDDFSPDFSFEASGQIVKDGWIAEFRIPLSTLRYPDTPVQKWGITLYRNYPRGYRRQMTSLPIPRGATCWLCYDLKLAGIRELPGSHYLLVVPFTTVQDAEETRDNPSYDMNAGLDLKWIPRNNITLDGTLNPDFAQVEADLPQISVNNRFALFYPEKRSFFLEGSDLYATPMKAVYTRTVTSPAWGIRGTSQTGNSAYTLLLTQDEGGGSRIVPGPVSSDLVPQVGHSSATIGRFRHVAGNSFLGVVFTDREGEDAFNRLLGPDFQWRPNETNQFTGQWLVSNSCDETLAPTTDFALSLGWLYSSPSNGITVDYQRLGHEFRADDGFIPQVGVDHRRVEVTHNFYPSGFLRWIRPGFTWDSTAEIGDLLVSRSTYPSLFLKGMWNSSLTLEYHIQEKVRTNTEVMSLNFFAFDFQVHPSQRVSALGFSGQVGEQVDVVNERIGTGGTLSWSAGFRPTIHLNLDLQAERQWLQIKGGNLFTANVAQVKTTYNFTSRMFIRVIGQFERIQRNADLYYNPVQSSEGDISTSVLYGYRFHWQTAIYAGYSDDRVLEPEHGYQHNGNHFFFKLAYAFER